MMLSLTEIRKSYGPLCVLQDVTLEAAPGEVTALVGPNASGKSTLMKILLGLVRPDRGEVRWQGTPLTKREGFQRLLGYMPQAPNFPLNLTPAEVVQIVADLRGAAVTAFRELAEEFRLTPFWERQIGTLSLGTRQKLSAVLALGVRAPILIFDEPTVGFDPAAAVVFRRLAKQQKDAGAAVLFVSHLVQEVEMVADRIVFIEEGKVRFCGTRAQLAQRVGSGSLEEAVLSFFDC